MSRRTVVEQAHHQLHTFLDTLKNGSSDYRTITSIGNQVAQEYRGRCVLELLQNAYDALGEGGDSDPCRIAFILTTAPTPVLLVANSGLPFRKKDFEGISQLGQSPKDPNLSVGNKGMGFRSVLEVCTSPEIWSTASADQSEGFTIKFSTEVLDWIATRTLDLHRSGTAIRSPFDDERPLVDWSEGQLSQFRDNVKSRNIDLDEEIHNFLSPYQFPLALADPPSEVAALFKLGYVSVIRLKLDGGGTGTAEEAVGSIQDQLSAIESRSLVFLTHLKELTIEDKGEVRVLKRTPSGRARVSDGVFEYEQIQISSEESSPETQVCRLFRTWTRTLGGDKNPEDSERIVAAVKHLPNQWPEMRQVTVGVAVEDEVSPEAAVFVIFLPTEVETGTRALLNAPFYGSLNRKHIAFEEAYNDLLISAILDLIIDVVFYLASESAEDWRGKAVVDLLASLTPVNSKFGSLYDRVDSRADEREMSLEELPFIQCESGWVKGEFARKMPKVAEEDPIPCSVWRAYAEFETISDQFESRSDAVEILIKSLGGSFGPTSKEWVVTLNSLAIAIRDRTVSHTWDQFMRGVVSILPKKLEDKPDDPETDPLGKATFIPTQDGTIWSPSGSARLFFQPRKGMDDAIEMIGEVPPSLKGKVAFLHKDVKIQAEDRRMSTPVRRFLDERFANTPRREDLLREVVIPAIPELPARHDTEDAKTCSELLSWVFRFINAEHGSTLELLSEIPVPCHGGWYAIEDAIFGPGWTDTLGHHLEAVSKDLPEFADQLLSNALLSPENDLWPSALRNQKDVLVGAGVVQGVRLELATDSGWKNTFMMCGSGSQKLMKTPPPGVPQSHWDSWRSAQNQAAEPKFSSWFDYELQDVWTLSLLHHAEDLTTNGLRAFTQLVLGSFEHWPVGWERVTLKKADGAPWSTRLSSPLAYWLESMPWLQDSADEPLPLNKRWWVPEIELGSQPTRFGHLDPLSNRLSRKLEINDDLRDVLIGLGLNAYPVEKSSSGPQLLNALSLAWKKGRIISRQFDTVLNQLRNAWKNFSTSQPFPDRYLVRTGRRSFEIYTADKLENAYLPDNLPRRRSLEEHGKPLLEMTADVAKLLKDRFTEETEIRLASSLQQKVKIDGQEWLGVDENAASLRDMPYPWLPPVLLAVAAHGGASPYGTATRGWQEALERLKKVHVLECDSIQVNLVDGEENVASSAHLAYLLPENVLAVTAGDTMTCEHLAPAAQQLLERQDLLVDLRFILGALPRRVDVGREQIEAALLRAEIEAEEYADVYQRWEGKPSYLLDRILPVLAVLGAGDNGLDAVVGDEVSLSKWLTEHIPGWEAKDLMATARKSRDDSTMGLAAWRNLGDVAQLPRWNDALSRLGDRYVAVVNRHVKEQVSDHLDALRRPCRGVARFLAIELNRPDAFLEFEDSRKQFPIPTEWATRWWTVPFAAVSQAVADLLKEAGYETPLWIHFSEAAGAKELAAQLSKAGVHLDPDPFDVATENRNRLKAETVGVHELYCAWMETRGESDPVPLPGIGDTLHPSAYLTPWTEGERLERSLELLGVPDFTAACSGCGTVGEIRDRLGLDSEIVKKVGVERDRKKEEEARKRRTFQVAGEPVEVRKDSYVDLLKRLQGIQISVEPASPDGVDDAFSPMNELPPGRPGGGGERGDDGRSPPVRPSAEAMEIVGVVGEMRAFQYLQARYGTSVVMRESWVSGNSHLASPLVPGQPNDVSDDHGFDFRFLSGEKTLHVEVKSSQGDQDQFQLGSSEYRKANQFAHDPKNRWLILMVKNALAERPDFEWLPNPFEEKYKKLYRIKDSGSWVTYSSRNG